MGASGKRYEGHENNRKVSEIDKKDDKMLLGSSDNENRINWGFFWVNQVVRQGYGLLTTLFSLDTGCSNQEMRY